MFPQLTIGLTYDLKNDYQNLGLSPIELAEFDSTETIEAIENTLQQLGLIPQRIGNIWSLTQALANNKRWDLVFNIAEGLRGKGREAQVPALLDAYNIPYTFSDPLIMALTLDKAKTKSIARDAGIPTANFFIVEHPADINNYLLEFPLFAKPIAEGTSKGINADSIVYNHRQLQQTCLTLLKDFKQPVIIEEFLPGREFTVGILGSSRTAKIAGTIEVFLKENAEQQVYSYLNKEHCEERVEYRLAEDRVAQRCEEIALKVWAAFDCKDAGRVDFRADKNGNPQFLELNPLSGLHPTHSDLPIICTLKGISYLDLISSIVKSALDRLT